MLKTHDVVIDGGIFCRLRDAVVRGRIQAECDVIGNRVRKQEDLLRHKADLLPERLQVIVFDVDAIYGDRTAVGIVHPHEQVSDRGFSRSCSANDRQYLPRPQVEGYVIQCLDARIGIGKRDVGKTHIALDGGSYAFAGVDGGFGVQKLVDAFLRGGCALHQRGHPGQCHGRKGELVDVDNELCNIARGNRSASHFQATDIHGDNRAKAHQKQDKWEEEGFGLDERQGMFFVCFALAVESIHLVLFPAIGLDDPYARERLLHKGGQGRKLPLDAFAPPVDDLVDDEEQRCQDRNGQEGIHGQFRVDIDHGHDDHDGQHQRVDGVHDGGAQIRSYPVDILGDAVH